MKVHTHCKQYGVEGDVKLNVTGKKLRLSSRSTSRNSSAGTSGDTRMAFAAHKLLSAAGNVGFVKFRVRHAGW